MATKTINSEILAKFEESVIHYMTPEEWSKKLSEINDMLTNYLLQDDYYIGNQRTADNMAYLRTLRDFFTEIK